MRSRIAAVFCALTFVLSIWVTHRLHLNVRWMATALADTLPVTKPAKPEVALPPPSEMPLPPTVPTAAPPQSTAPVPPAAPVAPSLPPAIVPGGGDSMPKFADQDFIYDPSGRRDPFKPYFSTDKVERPSTPILGEAAPLNTLSFLRTENEIGSGLEAFDLERLRLVGIMWDVNDPKAMVQVPQGKTYMVHKQTRIGRSNGYVAAIREGELVVVEISADGKTPSTRVLSLQK